LTGIVAMILIGGTTAMLLLGAVLSWFDKAFWLSFLYSLAATMGGVIGGIPAAFGLSRWQERRASRAAEAERAATAEVTKGRIIRVLLEEFRSNEERLASWKRGLAQSTKPIRRAFATEGWQVLKATGAFSKVDDVELFGRFAECYQAYADFGLLEQRLRGTDDSLLELIENHIEPKHAALRERLLLSDRGAIGSPSRGE